MKRERADEVEKEICLGIDIDEIISKYTNVHDLNSHTGKLLRKLEADNELEYASKEFSFSKGVSREAWNWYSENKPSEKAMKLREAAVFFATLADAVEIVEKRTDKETANG